MRYNVVSLAILMLAATPSGSVLSQQIGGSTRCPAITVSSPDLAVAGDLLTFSASVSGVHSSTELTFSWTTSAGVITKGQNTPSITVDTTGLGLTTIKATVEVGGLPEPCSRRASCGSSLGIADPGPLKLDEYGDVSFEDEKIRLDNLAVHLQNEPSAQPYIIAYAGRHARPGEAKGRASRAKSYLIREHGIDPERIVIVDGGYREIRSVELWLVPMGAVSLPLATPTIDPKDVRILKGGKVKSRRLRARGQPPPAPNKGMQPTGISSDAIRKT